MDNLTAKANVSGSSGDPQDVPILNIWDGVQGQYFDNERGVGRWGRGKVFQQMTTKTVVNTTIETSLIDTTSQVGTRVFPAGAFYVGDQWAVKAKGIISTTGSPTLNLILKLGSVVIAQTGALAAPSATNQAFDLEVAFTVRTLTNTGAIIAAGHAILNNIVFPLSNTSPITIDFTASQMLDLTATWDTASASNSISCQQINISIQ
jgi:hypothetical protein